MKRRKLSSRILAAGLAVSMGVLMVGCSQQSTEAEGQDTAQEALQEQDNQDETDGSTTSQEKVITVALGADAAIDQLDANSFNGGIGMFQLIYDGMVEYGDNGEIEPALAESWEISEDGKTYTFHLREGVTFSDGTPCDAQACADSFSRWMNNERYASLTICNAKSIDVVDEYTLKMTFEDAAYNILTEFSYCRPVRIMSPSGYKMTEDTQEGEFIEAIGTGPWMVESYTAEQEAVFVKNPNYWGEAPKVDKLVFKVIPDAEARAMALQTGEVDIAGGDRIGKLNLESVAMLKNLDNVTVEEGEGSATYYMSFNPENEVLKDVTLREAFAHAIDKDSIVANLYYGVGSAADGLFQPGIPYVNENNSHSYDYDIEKSKELLAEAGYADENGDGILEKDGTELKFSLMYDSTKYPDWKRVSEYFQSAFQEIGISIEIQALESNTYNENHANKTGFDLSIGYTASDSWQPHGTLKDYFTSSRNGVVIDEILDEKVNTFLTTLDEENRQKEFDGIMEHMYETVSCVPFYFPTSIFGVNERITDFRFGPTAYLPVYWSELDVQ